MEKPRAERSCPCESFGGENSQVADADAAASGPIVLGVHVGSRCGQLLDHVRLCLRSVKDTRRNRAGSAMWRIETTSCAVDAEGHLNAMFVCEVVSTFSAFQVRVRA
jgi:hypothetical protein